MAVTAAVVGLVGTLAATGVGAQQSRAQGIHADNARRSQESAQRTMQQQLQAQDDAEKAQSAQQADLRQRALASGYRNASGGFSTTPLGLPGGANTAKGSLLGL
jgi:hypothetical protein